MRRLSGMTGWAARTVAAFLITMVAWAGMAAVPGKSEVLVHDFAMSGDEQRMRITIGFDADPQASWYLLRGPERLVIDVSADRFGFSQDAVAPNGMVRHVRYGALADGQGRIIVYVNQPFRIADAAVSDDDQGHRLTIDIATAEAAVFEAALARQADRALTVQSTPKGDRIRPGQPRPDRRFTVVLDPGHGGIDGGARGVGGTVEKTITLAFALELRRRLEQIGRFRVVMTRDRDVFLRLDERVRIGRQHEADLFISIHADTINSRVVRGATVYTISERASDAIAQALAERENLSDAIAGVPLEQENSQVADILIDLVRRETQAYSVRFARSLVSELSRNVELIGNPHRSAGFRVLMAPDMPSVLVELGYLSNPKDEALLRDPNWRASAVDSIAAAVSLFAAAHERAGG